jgi:Protein tyrosine and serine/threonine kinase
MAPEVLAAQRYSETADVYSFALVFWELLTRQCPYEGLRCVHSTTTAVFYRVDTDV